jgi:hypothetical protein
VEHNLEELCRTVMPTIALGRISNIAVVAVDSISACRRFMMSENNALGSIRARMFITWNISKKTQPRENTSDFEFFLPPSMTSGAE